MSNSFNYIRNRIREHRKNDLIDACFRILDNSKDKHLPIWDIFSLLKWTLIYGGETYPSKELTSQKLNNILKSITNFNDEHVCSFMKAEQVDRAFLIIGTQQFYLQESFYIQKFATQLKLYNSIKCKYDINIKFEELTGLSVYEFLMLIQLTWLYINAERFIKTDFKFYGYLSSDLLEILEKHTSNEKLAKFVSLLLINDSKGNIKTFNENVKNEVYQPLGRTIFTRYPFLFYKNQIKLIHKSIFDYSINNFIYDFLKVNDKNFTTEFGLRFEKYIEFGIKEMNYNYLSENQLKKILPKNSKVVDFCLKDENIYMECKAIELQQYPSINPTDELIFNSLKDSIFKAYFEQLITVSKEMNNLKENWGVILTYKKFFWGHFIDLYEIGKSKYKIDEINNHLPPDNVFIIDVFTWDKIVYLVKNSSVNLIDLFKRFKAGNSIFSTKKLTFDMIIEEYKIKKLLLPYLNEEIDLLNYK